MPLTYAAIFHKVTTMPVNNITVDNSQPDLYPTEASREMIDAGVFYGRKKSKTHPKMAQFVIMNRGGIEIINLTKTTEELDKAMEFLKEKARHEAIVMLVGTQPAAEEGILKLADKFQLPYVTNRWAGGTITNFKIISKRVEYFKKLRTDFASGAMEKYTKKERVGLEKVKNRLQMLFGGLENLTKVPDVLVVIDPSVNSTAVREANRMKIPVIALANIDADPEVIDYLVPGNSNARRSINWFLEKVESAITAGLASKVEVENPEGEIKESGTKENESKNTGHTETA